MAEISVGVIGVGSFGKHHVRIYKELPQCRLAGIHDINADRAAEIADRFGTKAFPSLEALLDAVDAVTVATTTANHAPIAVSALEAGIHALVEKPIASTVKETDEILSAAARSGAVLAVGHVERFNPAFRTATDRFGKLRFFRSERLGPWVGRGADIDVVMDLMIHDLDLLAALDPSGVEEILAGGTAVLSGSLDLVNASLRLESGATAVLGASRVSTNRFRVLRLYSDDEYLSIDLLNRQASRARPHITENEAKILREGIKIPRKEPLREELTAFLSRASGKQTPITTGEEARRTLLIAKEIIGLALRQS